MKRLSVEQRTGCQVIAVGLRRFAVIAGASGPSLLIIAGTSPANLRWWRTKMQSRYFLVTCVAKLHRGLSLSRSPTPEQPGSYLLSGSAGEPLARCSLCWTGFLPKHPVLRAPETMISCRLNRRATGTHVAVPDKSVHGSNLA